MELAVKKPLFSLQLNSDTLDILRPSSGPFERQLDVVRHPLLHNIILSTIRQQHSAGDSDILASQLSALAKIILRAHRLC